jgi:hypothetical protein
MRLFRKYCLPAVQAQTFKEFDWWLMVDPTFPGLTEAYISDLEKVAKILWIEAPFREDQGEVGSLLSHIYKDEWVCSTRVDSDDILRNDFMEQVHAVATEDEAYIAFRTGYMFKDGYVAPKSWARNPFVSYVEYANPFRSIFSISHMAVNNQPVPLKIIETFPGWIQVDHTDNIKNLVNKKIKDFDSIKIDASLVYDDFTWER